MQQENKKQGRILKNSLSIAIIVLLSGASVAIAALTFSNTSITGDSSFTNVTGVVSSTWDFGAGTLSLQTASNSPITAGTGLFSINGTASTSQLYANSSTVTTFRYTNASGTNETLTGYLQMTGNNIFDANGNKYSTSTALGTLTTSTPYAANGVDYANAANTGVTNATSTFTFSSINGLGMLQVVSIASTSQLYANSSTIGTLLDNGGNKYSTSTALGTLTTSTPYAVNGLHYTNAANTGVTNASGTFTFQTISGLGVMQITSIASTSQLYANSSTITSLITTGNTSVGTTTVNSLFTVSGSSTFIGQIISTSTVGSQDTDTSATCGGPGGGGGGSAPTIVGSNGIGRFTTGSLATSSCVITFGTAFKNKPVCTVSAEAAATSTQQFWITPSTASLIVNVASSTAAFSSLTMDYVCIGQ